MLDGRIDKYRRLIEGNAHYQIALLGDVENQGLWATFKWRRNLQSF